MPKGKPNGRRELPMTGVYQRHAARSPTPVEMERANEALQRARVRLFGATGPRHIGCTRIAALLRVPYRIVLEEIGRP